MVYRSETGKNGTLMVAGIEIPFTSCDFTLEYETEQSDFSDDFFQWTGYISGHATGSFEWDGSMPRAYAQMIGNEGLPSGDIRLELNMSEENYFFDRVLIQSFDKANPTDSKTSGTVEWEADR